MPQLDIIPHTPGLATLINSPRVFADDTPATPERRRRRDYAAWYAAGHESALEGWPRRLATLPEDQPAADAGYEAGLAWLARSAA